jgi:predicted metal-dependent hydrolase
MQSFRLKQDVGLASASLPNLPISRPGEVIFRTFCRRRIANRGDPGGHAAGNRDFRWISAGVPSTSRGVNGGKQDSLAERAAPAKPELVFVRSAQARHYRLTLRHDGTAVATIPVRGSEREAARFVEQHRDWLARARARQARRPQAASVWNVGTRILWRGESGEIRAAIAGDRPQVCVAADVFRVTALDGDLRPALEAQFARRARIELPARAWELAAMVGVDVKQVTVRNQRTRWGSCSAGGTISLNWRLVQAPESVRDYIIYHELMHLREMNHSGRFWARVAEVCPWWREAERWLKRNGSLLGM